MDSYFVFLYIKIQNTKVKKKSPNIMFYSIIIYKGYIFFWLRSIIKHKKKCNYHKKIFIYPKQKLFNQNMLSLITLYDKYIYLKGIANY